jgi:hypothetical protein
MGFTLTLLGSGPNILHKLHQTIDPGGRVADTASDLCH